MKMYRKIAYAVALLAAALSYPSLASQEQEMLWLNVQSDKEPETTIAVSLPIARQFYAKGEEHLGFSLKDGKERELEHLIQEVLEGDRDEGEVYDGDTRVRVWKGTATIPGNGKKDGNTLVVEIREEGEAVTTIRLPNITIETTSQEHGAVVETSVGWRTFLPFLAEHGGAVYIATEKDETEIWVYVQ